MGLRQDNQSVILYAVQHLRVTCTIITVHNDVFLRSRSFAMVKRQFDLLTRYQRKSKSVNQKGVSTVV